MTNAGLLDCARMSALWATPRFGARSSGRTMAVKRRGMRNLRGTRVLIESLVQFASKAELSIAPGSHQGPASTIAPTNLADGDALPLLPTLKCLSSRREQKKTGQATRAQPVRDLLPRGSTHLRGFNMHRGQPPARRVV